MRGPDLPPPARRDPRQRREGILAAVLLLVAGVAYTGGDTIFPRNALVLTACTAIGAAGAVLAGSSWNDMGIRGWVDGRYLVATTIHGPRHIDLARITRVDAYQVKNNWRLRVGGPDGSLTVNASVPLAMPLVRAAILDRPADVAVTRQAVRCLELPRDLCPRVRGGRFLASSLGVIVLAIAGIALGTFLFYHP